jgi:DNA-directed RNA polymerase subunit RPC12/RpoP
MTTTGADLEKMFPEFFSSAFDRACSLPELGLTKENAPAFSRTLHCFKCKRDFKDHGLDRIPVACPYCGAGWFMEKSSMSQ